MSDSHANLDAFNPKRQRCMAVGGLMKGEVL